MAIAISKINEDNFIDIPGVIIRIDYKINNNITNKAYINVVIIYFVTNFVFKEFIMQC